MLRISRICFGFLVCGVCVISSCTQPYDGPTCAQWRDAPRNDKPFHPRLWHGTLNALPNPSASTWSLWSQAYAFAYEEEKPQADQLVEISIHHGAFVPHGKARHRTTTDKKGQWCVVVDADLALDASVVVHAPKLAGGMRHIATHHADLSINAQSEALTKWAAEQPSSTTWSRAHWLNVRTLADTASGLLGDVKPQSVSSQALLITRVHEALNKDVRLRAWSVRHAKTPATP